MITLRSLWRPVLALVAGLICALLPRSVVQSARTDFAVAIDGPPTITGGLNAVITGSTSSGSGLRLTIDFGEVSPLNKNRLVVVTVPLQLRSAEAYELVAAVSTSAGSDPNAVLPSDVGFGLHNLRSLGKFATACGASSTVATPFNNDPSVNVNLSRRASYLSSLGDLGLSRRILNGPKLSTKNVNNKNQNGYAIDAVLAIAPQFYSVGAFSATLTLTLRPGPALPCSG